MQPPRPGSDRLAFGSETTDVLVVQVRISAQTCFARRSTPVRQALRHASAGKITKGGRCYQRHGECGHKKLLRERMLMNCLMGGVRVRLF